MNMAKSASASTTAARSQNQPGMREFLETHRPADLREALTALRNAFPCQPISRRVNACVQWYEKRTGH